MSFSIAVAQLNLITGDLPGNTRRIAEAAARAHADGTRLLLTPQLALCGPDPQDLLLQPAFVQACEDAVQELAAATSDLDGMTLVVGHPARAGGGALATPGLWNAVSVIRDGMVLQRHGRQWLAADEHRYFVPGSGPCVLDAGGLRLGVLISDTAPAPQAAAALREAGAQAVLVAGASPYVVDGAAEREQALGALARGVGLPLLFANPCGAQDGLVFDGASLALAADGSVLGRAPSWEEALFRVSMTTGQGGAPQCEAALADLPEHDAGLWQALVLGLRDYVRKNGMGGVALGLSGGLDSALVLALAVDALGADRVRTLFMPGPYTADISAADARDMAQRLGVQLDEISIVPEYQRLLESLQPLLAGRPADTTEENLQARIRGVMLMALSNKHGHLVLVTSNKSETAVGYSTLYGDMCGGYAPIKDVIKSAVFRLARWRNAHDPFGRGSNPIPLRIIERPPSAELRADQTDQDSLPPYDVLDPIIEGRMEHNGSVADLVARGFDRGTVERVVRLINGSEYKRRQAAVGTRVTRRGFDGPWRYPMTHKFKA